MYIYVEQNKKLLYGVGLLSFILLITGMVMFASSHDVFLFYIPFIVVVFFYLGLSLAIGIFGRAFSEKEHGHLVNMVQYLPTVDVFLPSCGEPLEVLENTYKHVRDLKYPEGKLHVYVLDDSARGAVRALADRFDFNYLSRADRGRLKKSGNVRFGFSQSYGDLILILDADFVPRPRMLDHMVPYFWKSDIAIVQTPQFFSIEEGQTWVEKGSAYVQELFYRMVQTNRDRWGSSICVGTCALYRRSALAPHGGTYPIEYSEDLHTGFRALCDGWRVKYIPLCLSKGICPESMSAYFVQQTRWCTGSTSLLLSKQFWSSPLSGVQKLCYMSGMLYYFATALSLVLTPLPGLIIVWFFPERLFWYNYVFSIPSFLYGTLILALWGRLPFGSYVFSARQVSYYAHLFALWDKFRGSMIPWISTGDRVNIKKVKRYQDFKSLMFAFAIGVYSLGVAGAFYQMHTKEWWQFTPFLFFTGFNFWIQMRCFSEES